MRILEKLRARKVQSGEVFLSEATYQQVVIRRGRLGDTKSSLNIGYSIRLVANGKVGFAYSTDLSDSGIALTIDNAISVLPYAYMDSGNALPAQNFQFWTKPLENYDKQIKDLGTAELIYLAGTIEKATTKLHASERLVTNVGLNKGTEKTYLVSTHMPLIKEAFSYIGANANCIALRGTQQTSALYMQHACSLSDFQPDIIGREASRRACMLLGAAAIASGKKDIVLDPFVTCKFLSFMAPLFSAESYFKGKSLLADKLGSAISPAILTIIDDGRLPGKLASSYYDGEGVPTQETIVIDKGTFKNCLCDTRYASKMKTKSTGNASRRGAYKSPPSISPSNLYIRPGKFDKDALVKQIASGIYVLNVMGMHTANPFTGDYSIGIEGILIENGELTTPVKGITMAGNLIDFLGCISGIADDLQFFYFNEHVGAPTIHVSDVMIGA